MTAPRGRSEGLILEEVDGELLVYDRASDRAHCLTPEAARIFRACDGRRDVAAIARAAGVEEAVAWSALRQLATARLLAAPLPRRRPTRREVLVVAALAPMVATITAPSTAQAASCLSFGSPCRPGGTPCCPPFTCRNDPHLGHICE